MGLYPGFHQAGLLVQHADHRSRRPYGGGAGRRHHRRLPELPAARRGLDLPGLLRHPAAAGTRQRRADPRDAQPGRAARIGCLSQQLQGAGSSQAIEGPQRGGKELPQRRPQPQHVPGPFPDQELMRAGDYPDCLRQVAIPGRRPQLMRIGADHARQHARIPGAASGSRGPVPLPVPGRLPRVHRIHHATRGDQRSHPRAPVSLDPGHHLTRPVTRISEPAGQLMKPGNPGHALTQPGPPEHPPRPVPHPPHHDDLPPGHHPRTAPPPPAPGTVISAAARRKTPAA